MQQNNNYKHKKHPALSPRRENYDIIAYDIYVKLKILILTDHSKFFLILNFNKILLFFQEFCNVFSAYLSITTPTSVNAF